MMGFQRSLRVSRHLLGHCDTVTELLFQNFLSVFFVDDGGTEQLLASNYRNNVKYHCSEGKEPEINVVSQADS